MKPTESLGLMGDSVQRLNPGNLKDIMELYHHSGIYLKAITPMLDIYNLEHRGGVGEDKDQRNSISQQSFA
jgi:hypothetical protein